MAEEAATPDLVERLRGFHEAINRGDFQAVAYGCTPDAVWDNSPSGLGTYKGKAAILGWIEEWFDSFEEVSAEIEEMRDLGNSATFIVVVQRGRPFGGTGVGRARYASVATWADGLVQRVTNYTDIDEARAAAERLAQERG